MKTVLIAAAACALLGPFAALAQEAAPTAPPMPAAAAPAPVTLETLEVGGSMGLTSATARVGGATLVSRKVRVSSGGFTRTRSRITVHFTFTPREGAAEIAGSCTLRAEGRREILGTNWESQGTQGYVCTFTDQPTDQFAMEVALPAFRESGRSLGLGVGNVGVAVSGSRTEDSQEALQAVLRANMIYRGVAYEALPTGFGREAAFEIGMPGMRIVQGYAVTRDGQPVGGVQMRGNPVNRGTVTAPAAEAEGREAVLFMTLSLLAMPDIYHTNVRDELR